MLDELLEESWAFQEILQKGFEQGFAKGFKQGFEQGFAKGFQQGLEQGRDLSRQTLIALVENLYPALVTLAKKKVDGIADQQTLQNLILRVVLAKHEAEAREYLKEE